jgi:long-chain acyl-CoA synthetase
VVVIIEPSDLQKQSDIQTLAWDDVMSRGEHGHTNIVDAAEHINQTDIACIIYTSGTSGKPKGVMLDHRAILHNCDGARAAIEELGLDNAIFLSFLPLSHAYEHTAGQFLPIHIGAQIYYAEGVDKLSTNLLEVKPTLMTAVPRLYEALHQRILHGIRKTGGLKERLFMQALSIGSRRYHDPDGLRLTDRLMDPFLERLVRDKVRARFGGRLKAMISGGAPLVPEVGVFFSALGLPVFQGYGQTEAAPLISVNLPSKSKMDTVGPPIKGVKARIADDGEILVRGNMVMQGYWRNPEATAAVIRDGWLHTGDIGEIDEDGYIRITDRKKDIIVNSGGDNLSPSRVEGMLTMQPEIAQAMVHGDRRPHLVALLVPDEQWMSTWARSAGKQAELAKLANDADFRKAIGEVIDRVNRDLSVVEKVRKFTFANEPFTIENSQLTPTMKIRRHVLKQTYGGELEALYG